MPELARYHTAVAAAAGALRPTTRNEVVNFLTAVADAAAEASQIRRG